MLSDESKYTEEVRQGLGVIGAEIKSACYKKTDKSAKTGSDADACEKLSKEEYKAAGGDEKISGLIKNVEIIKWQLINSKQNWMQKLKKIQR